ncbi:hypothetical protein JCM8097_008962 [Rhodosporidiobolus ruineniae]
MSSDSAFPTAGQLVDKVPLIRNPGFWVPKPVELPQDIHPLPDDVHAYFVYPHTLEAHVLSTLPTKLQTLEQAHNQRLALLASYADSKERARKARLNQVAPGWNEGGQALEPVRRKETALPSAAGAGGSLIGGSGDEHPRTPVRGDSTGEGSFLGEGRVGSPREMGAATLDGLQRDQMLDFVEGLEKLDTSFGGLPPRPPTPGVGPTPETTLSRLRGSRAARFAAFTWRWKGLIAGGAAAVYTVSLWNEEKRRAIKRDTIHDNTYLYWKIYDGGIVEAKSAGSNLNYLLSSSQGGSPDEPPRVMELFEVIRTIKMIEGDDRIRGLIADFSSTSVPSVPSYNLGLAQLEEIQDALLELRRVKQEKFGAGAEKEGAWRSVAFSDTFYSQGQYLLATAFDEVYLQPSGEVPLVGMGSTVPFYGRLAKWLGIDVHAEARNEYKSFVQPYIDEQLTEPQRENHLALLSDLNDNLLTYIGRNRYPSLGGQGSLDHTKALTQVGPFPAPRAAEAGLIDGTCYRQDVLDAVLLDDADEATGNNLMGFYHYNKIIERAIQKRLEDTIEVGVVYLLGTIGDPGEFGTAAVVRGLKEAADDDTIGAVVLRVDSGGGSVVDSDTIGAAVRDLKNKGKTVVASFGNSSASGGYWVSTDADMILAAPSTVTGSIGVAALRPTFLQRFFDRFHITLEHLYLGSRATDVTHPLSADELARYKAGVDDMYASFKQRVCDGRGVSPEAIEGIAGGRVMTGLKAFGLVAPEELIRQIKGLDIPPVPAAESAKMEEVKVEGASAEEANEVQQVLGALLEKGQVQAAPAEAEAVVQEAVAAAAVFPEGQEMSSFAVPEVVEACAPSTSPSSSVNSSSTSPAEPSSSSTAIDSSSPTDSSDSSPSASSSAPAGAVNGAAGTYEYDPTGPYGRGLVDGLGGLRDAAIYACQQFIANGLAGYKEQNPGVSDTEALQTLLPDAKFVQAEGGELAMQVDVRLKRFPVHKSFWQQLAEASRRGDSMADQLSLSILPSLEALRSSVARYFLSAIADSVVRDLGVASELDGVRAGVRGTGTPGLSAGGPARASGLGGRGGMRAEWAGLGGGRWV